ncbi:LexA family protein [Rhodohalobacter halophilus]|uniref:LexA family protein n=1 Tax=Rhodohalobacter halophilus TaxID=1812810 RepID=UPI000A03F457|nr:S24 family peptidase [Rhodohalobacter halophilus]
MNTAIAYPSQIQHDHEPAKRGETGFPSPATDHLENELNLHNHLIKRPASTFFARFDGDSENSFGIGNGDILIIDRSLAPKDGSMVLAVVDGNISVCRVTKRPNNWVLVFSDGRNRPINFDENETVIWGKVTHVVHSV